MEMTIGQFINECTYFEYSQEYFELAKLANEIDVTDQYIESCHYGMTVDTSEYTESFFIEANENNVNNAKTKNDEKKENFLKRAWEKFKKILASFGRFFKRIAAKLTKGDKSFINKLNGVSLDVEDTREIYKDFINSGDKWLIPIDHDKVNDITYNGKKIKISFAKNVEKEVRSSTLASIQAAISDVIYIRKENWCGIMNQASVQMMVDKINGVKAKNPNEDPSDFETVVDEISKLFDASHKLTGAMPFYLDSHMVSQYIKNLDILINTLTSVKLLYDDQARFNRNFKTISNLTQRQKDHSSQEELKYTKLAADLSRMIGEIGTISKMFADLAAYRSKMATKLPEIFDQYNIFNKRKQSDKTEQNDTSNQEDDNTSDEYEDEFDDEFDDE